MTDRKLGQGAFGLATVTISLLLLLCLPAALGVSISTAASPSAPAPMARPTPFPAPPTYTVTFAETGLAVGTSWYVIANGTNISGRTPTLTISLINGLYTYSVENPVRGPPGVEYIPTNPTGTFAVNGTAVRVNVPFTIRYLLTVAAAPAGAGTVSPATGWEAAGSQANLSAVPSAGYAFTGWVGTGVGSYTGPSLTATIFVNNSITETANFGVSYPLTFTETGLPAGTNWSVTISSATGSLTLNQTTASLVFHVANGTYTFAIAPSTADFYSNITAGTATVRGAASHVLVNWLPRRWAVQFVGSGFPANSSLTFSVQAPNGTTATSVNGIAVLTGVVDGTYTFAILAPNGWQSTPASAPVTVNRGNASVFLVFSRSSPSASGVPVTNVIIVVSVVIFAAAVAIGIVMSRRRKPQPPKPWAPSPPGEPGTTPATEGAAGETPSSTGSSVP